MTASHETVDFSRYLSERRKAVDETLNLLLPVESEVPDTIHRAMRYSVFAGGKRLRPILVLAAGESLDGGESALLHLGAAIEFIHTYSLIHDDLPALDNDDLRRGRPTCHKVFGEAMAILAGDSLLTRAFQVLSDLPDVSEGTRLSIVREIAYAIGTVEGMIGGQVVDLESEGKSLDSKQLEYIHSSKTGALLTACTRCGAMAAGAGSAELSALTEFGRKIGLAFQIVDDILDIVSTTADLGKTAGKDQKVHKATYPALYGLDASRQKARDLVGAAIEDLERFNHRADPLRSLASYVHDRTR